MAVKLHRCPFTFLHTDMDACWRVQRALSEQGIEFEVVKEPYFPKSRRAWLKEHSGQELLPAIEFEDGTVYRAESKDMAARIDAGNLGTTA